MLTTEIITAVNNLSDETETRPNAIEFLNDAMARINVFMNCGFPYLSATVTNDAPVFSEKWQRTLLIPFAVGRIKQKDSSQFEYSDAYREFMDNLGTFQAKYRVPTMYKCLVAGQTILLADAVTEYDTEEDDTLLSISIAHDDMDIDDILAANEDTDDGIVYVTDGISSNVYDFAPAPWMGRW